MVGGETDQLKNVDLSIPDLACGHCAAAVKSALVALEGVRHVEVSLPERRARVSADENLDNETVIEAVHRAGYSAGLFSG